MEQTITDTNTVYEYRHANGEVHSARDFQEALGRCAVLAEMDDDEARLTWMLYARGVEKIAGDQLTLADDENEDLVPETLELETLDSQRSHRIDTAREIAVEIIEPKPGIIKSDSPAEVISAELTNMSHGPSGVEQGSGSTVESGGRTIEISSPAQDRSDPPPILNLGDKKIAKEAYSSTPWQFKEEDPVTNVVEARLEDTLPIARPVLMDEYQSSKDNETLPPIKKDKNFQTSEPKFFETEISDNYEVESKPIHSKPEANAPDNAQDFVDLEQEPKIYKASSQTTISGTTKAERNTLEHSEILDAIETLPDAPEKLEGSRSFDLELSGEIIEFELTRPDHLNIELAETPKSSPPEIVAYTHEETFKLDPELSVPVVQVEATLAMVADRIDALESKRLMEVNQILDDITEILHQAIRPSLIEVGDEKVALHNVEAEEQVKEKFILLFNTLDIDYTPELAESFAKLTLSTSLVELISKINIEQPDDPVSDDKGTHEIIQKLILAADNFKKLGIYAYKMGELALRLYSRKGMIIYA